MNDGSPYLRMTARPLGLIRCGSSSSRHLSRVGPAPYPYGVLMPSTPLAYPRVVSRCFASFRVVTFRVSAGHRHICSGFDSRQLHKKIQVSATSPGLFLPVNIRSQRPPFQPECSRAGIGSIGCVTFTAISGLRATSPLNPGGEYPIAHLPFICRQVLLRIRMRVPAPRNPSVATRSMTSSHRALLHTAPPIPMVGGHRFVGEC